MSKRLSKEQRKKYLAHRGMQCPYCDSRQLDALGKAEIDGPMAAVETTCVACGETWWDIFTLTDIQEERERQPCQTTRSTTR